MEKIRLRNWFIFIILLIGFVILWQLNAEGFWLGFLLAGSFLVFFSEIFFLATGKDIKNYIFKNKVE